MTVDDLNTSDGAETEEEVEAAEEPTGSLFEGEEDVLKELAEKSKGKSPDDETPTKLSGTTATGDDTLDPDDEDTEPGELEEEPDPAEPKPVEPGAEIVDITTDGIALPSTDEADKIVQELTTELTGIAEKVDAEVHAEIKALDEEYGGKAVDLFRQRSNLETQWEAFKTKCKDDSFESGFRPLTPDETLFSNQLQKDYEKLQERIRGTANEYEEKVSKLTADGQKKKAEAGFDPFMKATIKRDPRLKPYEAEARELLKSGYSPDKTELLLAAAKALHTDRNGPPPKTRPTKEEVEAKVLRDSIEKKKKATISAGKGGAGLAKTEKKDPMAGVPDRLRGSLSRFESMLGRGR